MRILVIYYSKSGQTKSVAERIVRATDADVEEIVEAGKRGGNVRSALDAIFKRKPALKPFGRSLDDYDLVVIGTPIWRMNAVPAIQAFLATQEWNSRQVALFCTMGGMGDKRAFATMRQLVMGARVIGELAFDGPALKDDVAVDARVTGWVEEVRSKLS
jgi:flavodoxin